MMSWSEADVSSEKETMPCPTPIDIRTRVRGQTPTPRPERFHPETDVRTTAGTQKHPYGHKRP